MVSLERLGTVSYSHSTVTMVVSCIISEIKRDIGRKSWFFSYTTLHSSPPLEGSTSEYCRIIWCSGCGSLGLGLGISRVYTSATCFTATSCAQRVACCPQQVACPCTINTRKSDYCFTINDLLYDSFNKKTRFGKCYLKHFCWFIKIIIIINVRKLYCKNY